MPIYEYECKKCGIIEVMQKITDASLKKCPKCKSSVRKLVSQSSFQLKGSGWYVTDYKRGDGGNGRKKKEDVPSGKVDLAKTESSKEESAGK